MPATNNEARQRQGDASRRMPRRHGPPDPDAVRLYQWQERFVGGDVLFPTDPWTRIVASRPSGGNQAYRLAPGVFEVHAAITFANAVTLIANPYVTTIQVMEAISRSGGVTGVFKLTAAGTVFDGLHIKQHPSSTAYTVDVAANYCVLTRCKLDGPGTDNPVRLTGASFCRLTGCRIQPQSAGGTRYSVYMDDNSYRNSACGLECHDGTNRGVISYKAGQENAVGTCCVATEDAR